MPKTCSSTLIHPGDHQSRNGRLAIGLSLELLTTFLSTLAIAWYNAFIATPRALYPSGSHRFCRQEGMNISVR
jgi:hypothetical protein